MVALEATNNVDLDLNAAGFLTVNSKIHEYGLADSGKVAALFVLVLIVLHDAFESCSIAANWCLQG